MKRHTWQSGLNNGKSDECSRPAQPPISCPECGSARTWRDGLRHVGSGCVQRWICRDCGYRFSEPSLSNKKADRHSLECQVCETETEGSKNLVEVETTRQEWAAGATELSNEKYPGKIIEYSFWMLKQGYAKSTIEGRTKLMRRLVKLGANIFDPESIKEVIAKQVSWSEGRKEYAVETYSSFLLMVNGKWDPPRYHRIEKLPFIPTELEIDQLIAGCGSKTATFLQLLKETAMRAGEAWNLKWTDVDFTNSTIRVTPEKHSNPRMFKISSKLLAMLAALPKKSEKLFGSYELRGFVRPFQRQRKRLSQKLGNPRLQEITFHTFRHWKATMEYHKTKDILHVMRLLGHKNIKNTLIYTQLVTFEDDDYICKAASNVKEATELIEAGYEYVCDMENVKMFRKRK